MEELKNIIEGNQCGFRQSKSTIDQVAILREIQAQSYECTIDTALLFVDFRQAYDKVKKKKYLQQMK